MSTLIDSLIAALLLVNLGLVGSSRLTGCIRLAALQGVLVGLLPLVSHAGVAPRTVILALGVISLKGIVFPRLLANAIRNADVRREIEPFVGFSVSLLMALGLVAVSFWLGSNLPLPENQFPGKLVIPGALCTILIGLFLIISRRKAVNQVLGYLVIENGIAAFGLALVPDIPMLIELGILLDVFFGIFIMAIMIYRIGREFNHIDVDRLSTLKG